MLQGLMFPPGGSDPQSRARLNQHRCPRFRASPAQAQAGRAWLPSIRRATAFSPSAKAGEGPRSAAWITANSARPQGGYSASTLPWIAGALVGASSCRRRASACSRRTSMEEQSDHPAEVRVGVATISPASDDAWRCSDRPQGTAHARGTSTLTDPAPYPSRDSRASYRADSSAERAGRCGGAGARWARTGSASETSSPAPS